MSFNEVQAYIENKRWDDLLIWCSTSQNSIFNFFTSKDSEKDFFEQIPDEYLFKLIEIDTKITLSHMLNNYNPKYHAISLKLINSNMYNVFCNELIPLLDNDHIITIIQSIIPARFLEDEKDDSIFYRHALTGQFKYNLLTPKVIRSSQNLIYSPKQWLSKIFLSRKDLIPIFKELLTQIFTYASDLDSNTVKPILKCGIDIYTKSDNVTKSILASTLTNFNYPKVFKNTLLSSFLETAGDSEFNFYKEVGLSKSSELYFIPECVKEINDSFDSKDSQITLRSAALKMFSENKDKEYFQTKMLMIKHYSYIENHPLKNAWKYMVSYLKEMIIKEIIQTGKSVNLNNIISSLFIQKRRDHMYPAHIDKVSLSFDESIEIIENTLKSYFAKKAEICSIDPQRYSNCLLSIISILVGTYSIEHNPSKYLYKSSDIFRSALTFISNEIRDQLIKESLFDPVSNSSLANWAQNGFHSDIIGMALRISNIDEIAKLIPLNCKQLKNDIADENLIDSNIEFDEFSFSKNEISFKVNEKLTLTGHFSFVELFLFQTKFWSSNSQRIYTDSFAILQKHMNILQVIALSTKNKKRLEQVYHLNIRLIQLLMLPTTEVHTKFRFGFLSEVFSQPYSLSVGSIYKSSTEFSKEILQLIERMPCTATDPVNLPFRIAINLIQNSYCKELPSLSEPAEIITQGCLEYCIKSLDSLMNLDENRSNHLNIDGLFDISDSVCSVRNLFAPPEVNNNDLIQNDHYKDFVRQVLNGIDSAASKFIRVSSNIHCEQTVYSIEFINGWTKQIVPSEAYKNAEEMDKTPTITSGSGLKAALTFMYNLLIEKAKQQPNNNNNDEELPYFTSFKYQMCNFLNSEIKNIKKFMYSIKPQDKSILQPSTDPFKYPRSFNFFSTDVLVLSPLTAQFISSLIGNQKYEEIIGNSDLPIAFIESICNTNCFRNKDNKTLWKEISKISQILSDQQQNEKSKSKGIKKDRPYFLVNVRYNIPEIFENNLHCLTVNANESYINYMKSKISDF